MILDYKRQDKGFRPEGWCYSPGAKPTVSARNTAIHRQKPQFGDETSISWKKSSQFTAHRLHFI